MPATLNRLFAAVLLCVALASAQETRGVISGRVLDPQSSAVAAAKVSVVNTETNTRVDLTTNASGYFEASLLLPGDYQVSAEAAGFKKMVRSGMTLSLGGRLDVDLRLELGAVSDSVSVTAEAPMLDTSVVSTGRVVDRRDVMELPTMGNAPMLLVKLTPGVSNNGIARYSMLGFVTANAEYSTELGVGSPEWSIDGAPNNGRDGLVASSPYADTVQEMKVETSNFDASSGHSTGVNVSVMTRSGTNTYHGTATEQYWTSRFIGLPFFVKQQLYRDINIAEANGDKQGADYLRSHNPLGSAHASDFAATIGGPIVIPKLLNGRNKLFFFASYAGQRDRRPEDTGGIQHTVPTMAERTGDFSSYLLIDPARYQIYDPLSIVPDPARPTHYIRTPFSGNIIPKARMINPMYDAYTKFTPTPNNLPTNPKLEPTLDYRALGQPDNEVYDAVTGRIDYNHSSKHRFFLRWGYNTFLEDKGDWTFATSRHLHSNDDSRINWNGTLDWTYVPNGSTVFDFQTAVNNYNFILLFRGMQAFKPTDVGLPTYVDDKASDKTILPSVSVSGYHSYGASFPAYQDYNTFTNKVSVSHVRTNHTIKAGFEQRLNFHNDKAGGNTSGSFSFGNTYTRRNDDTLTSPGSLGLSWAAFMMGLPDNMSIATTGSWSIYNPFYAWYAQDAWRITRNLTVNYAIRMEWEGGITERYNRMLASFDQNAKLLITDAAQAAYAAKPLTEVAASAFQVRGGTLYAGAGAPSNLWKGNLSFQPRLSFAWQLGSKTVIRGGYGMSYDSQNATNSSPDQTGYSRTTSTTLTTDFGSTWLVGNPGAGVSPLRDPFPVRSNGTRFDAPFGNSFGLMARAGNSFSWDGYELKNARVQNWRLGIQRQITANMIVEAAYTGNFANRLSVSQSLTALPEKYWIDGMVRNNTIQGDLTSNVTNPFALANFTSIATTDPLLYQTQLATSSFFIGGTVQKNRLLRQFPQMSGLTFGGNAYGKAFAHSAELTLQRRFSKGFNMNLAYTGLYARSMTTVLNEYETAKEYLPTNNSRPYRFTATGIYEFPFGKTRAFWHSGVLNHLFGGWQAALTYEKQPGPLLSFGNLFYYGDLNDINTGERTLDRWFNTANFETVSAKTPTSFHKRVFPTTIEGLRADGQNLWNGNLQRNFTLREGFVFQVRADALNLANHSQFAGPSTSTTSSNFGKVTSTTGQVNRFFQFQARLRF